MKNLKHLFALLVLIISGNSFSSENEGFEDSYYHAINTHATQDPISFLKGDKNALREFILSAFNEVEDRKFLELKLSVAGDFASRIQSTQSDNSLELTIDGKTMTFSDVNMESMEFKLSGHTISLKDNSSLKDLFNLYEKIDNPFTKNVGFRLPNLFMKDAHALGPFAIGFLAAAAWSSGMLTAQEFTRKLNRLESKISDAEAICDDLEYGSDFDDDEALRQFEKIKKGLYSKASGGKSNKVRKVRSCSEIKGSWWEGFKSWLHSFFSASENVYRDRIVELCERAVKVDKCIHGYRNRGNVVDGLRDPSDPRFRVYDGKAKRRSRSSNRE